MDQKMHGSDPGEGDLMGRRPSRMRLPRDSFRRFDQWMDGQLAALVARWARFAGPKGGKPWRRFRRPKPRRRKPR